VGVLTFGGFKFLYYLCGKLKSLNYDTKNDFSGIGVPFYLLARC